VSLLAAAALFAACQSDASPAEGGAQDASPPKRHAQIDRPRPKSSKPSANRSADVKSPTADPAAKGRPAARARNLRARTGCNADREPIVRFRWSPAPDGGPAQRVDYTEFFAGLSGGDFHRSPRLSGQENRWRTGNIETGIHYEWRVMTRHGRRWVTSAVRSFDGPVCIQDGAVTSPTGQ